MEQKGLDIVRRDWCPLCKDVGNFALRAILSGRPREEVVDSIHEHLGDVKEKVGGQQGWVASSVEDGVGGT
jgi:DNA polymerase alpha subunit A